MKVGQWDAPSVLIAGLHKSGTTGVYDTVRSAVPEEDEYVFLYEPKTPEPFLALGRYAPYRPIVAKLLIHQIELCAPRFDDFDRRIMLVRDPRDIVISRLLFRPMFGGTSYHIDVQTLEPFVAALKKKEANPASHSVKGLHDLADNLEISSASWQDLLEQMREQTRLINEQDFLVLRYEDFVDGRLDEASKYLGVSLGGKQTTDRGWKSHIARSMNYGEWKRWFLDEDIEFFGEMFGDYMKRFGYSGWERDSQPKIDPATSSEYIAGKTVDRIVERQDRRKEKWKVRSVQTEQELRQIESMAADGRATWAYRTALVYDRSKLFGRDRAQALQWARHGAVLGHPHSMALLARYLREDAQGGRETLLEARFWQREHDVLTGQQRTTSTKDVLEGSPPGDLAAELAHTRRALQRVKSSGRYRFGSAIAEAVANPRKCALSAFREIGGLARRRLARRRARRR